MQIRKLIIPSFLVLAACTKMSSNHFASSVNSAQDPTLNEPLAFDKLSAPQTASAAFVLKGKCLTAVAIRLQVQDAADLAPVCVAGLFEISVLPGGSDGAKVMIVTQTSGAQQWQDSVSVIKDTTAPVVTIVSVAKVGAALVINGTCEGADSLGFAGDLVSAATFTCSNNLFQATAVPSAGDGSKIIEIHQTDKAGNRGRAQRLFVVDTSVPVVTIAAPAPNTQFSDGFTLQGVCESGLDVIGSGSGVAAMVAAPCLNSAYSLPANLSASLGNKQVLVSQTDLAGNRGQAMVTLVRIAPAIPPPAIAISLPLANSVFKTGLTLSGTCTAGLTVNISGAVSVASTTTCAAGTFSAALLFSNGDGNKTITVAQTNAQNATGSASRNFIRDSIAPNIMISAPTANAFVGATATVSGACETGITVVLYGAGTTANAAANCVNGAYSGTVTLTAGDGVKEIRAGQTDAATNAGVAVVNVQRDSLAPIVRFTDPAAGTMAATGLNIKGSCENGLMVTASGTGVASNVSGSCVNQAFAFDLVFSAGDGMKAVTITQTDGAGNSGSDARSFVRGVPLVFDGAVLYAQHCAICHNPLATSLKLDRTSGQIQSARIAVPSMAASAGIAALSIAQIDAIAVALKTITAPGVNPFLCNAAAQPAAHRLQRLAKSEYVNTIRDLFAGVVTLAEIQSEVDLFPAEVNQSNPFDRGADSLNLGLVQAQDKISSRIATLVTSTTAKMNMIFSEACLADAAVTDLCLTTFINRFGARVYRRPVKTAEVTPLINAYRIGASRVESSGFILRAMLMSPIFLYHTEYDGTVIGAGPDLTLSAYELANRLSYITLNSMPDAALTAAAANGSLLNAATYNAQMVRLLALPTARASFRRFFNLWFELNLIRPNVYSAAFRGGIDTTNINTEAIEEALLFSDHVVFENKKLGGLLTDNTAFVKSNALAQIYGISLPAAVDGRVTLPAGQRGGILTRAARTLSGRDGTSPILRGSSIRRSLLCDPISPPDPNSLPPGSLTPPPDDPLLSTRKRYENKTSAPICNSCHSTFNPFGYALEGYDGLGRFRTVENIIDAAGNLIAQHPVDAKVTVSLGAPPDPMVDGGLQMSGAIAGSTKFQACFAKKWFQFSMRRTSSLLDNCQLAATYDVLADPNATLLDAIKSMISNSEFKLRRMK